MILLGLTGSVASTLASKMIKALILIDPHVEVIMTERAGSFTLPDILLEAGAKKVYTDKDEWSWLHSTTHGFGEITSFWRKDDPILHIELRERADEMVIAPLTANTMAKMANGICDNLLTSVVRAWDPVKKLTLAPAMNTNMWEHPLTRKHIDELKGLGYRIVNPQKKMLACGVEGMGAMANITEIVYEMSKWRFPLKYCKGIPVDPHPGAFGYLRRDKRHTGVDLYTSNDNQPIYAVEYGTVVCIEHFTGEWDNSPWWNNTDCIMVEGKTGVVCYGELTPKEGLKVGDRVKTGEYIGNVKRVIKEGRERPDIPGHSPSMLHMELYPKGTTHPSCGFEPHLLDPTKYLLDAIGRNEYCTPELRFADYKPA